MFIWAETKLSPGDSLLQSLPLHCSPRRPYLPELHNAQRSPGRQPVIGTEMKYGFVWKYGTLFFFVHHY